MNKHLALVSTQGSAIIHAPQGARLTQRVLVQANELYRVPPTFHHVRVKQGIGHISHGGRDFIICPGDLLDLQRIKDVALVSPLQSESLVLELFE